MIRAEVDADGVVLVADLPRGSLAYVDRDWLPTSSGRVPSIVVAQDGRVAWCDGPAVEGSGNVDPGAAAALVLLTVAREAAAAVEGLAPVAITGSGLVARQVRALVEEHRRVVRDGSERVERPRAIVDTSGDPTAILDATRRVTDLGTVVLVGERLGRGTELNLYPDVHVRGLTLVGVAPPLDQARSPASDDASLVAWCRECLGEVRSGSVVPENAAWYCVTA